ncbi:MAG TPA: HlyD family type I secretion periplasmic adaptor subunit, partial [Candidatus Nitrosotenuis sp.]|nr:HlyD family type I secretion periplasmic adaptor subunit [Candidatus Nitrosotenuis sp.]
LFEKGFTTKTNVLEAEKEYNIIEGEIEKTKSEISQHKQSIAEFETRLKSLESSLRDEALEKLATLESEIVENSKNIEKLKNQIDRLEVRSPVKGIVKGLEVTTIGGVVAPGQKIMEIVPIDDVMLAEVKIFPGDIGNLKIGQECLVKVSAYDFSRYGSIEGELIYLSATTFVSKEGITYYKGRIKLTKNYVGNNPNVNIVLPGMVVNADIITGEKTILGYLLKPIQVTLSTALREK